MRKLKILLEEKTKERLEFNKKLLKTHLNNVVDHSVIISNIIYETISKKGKSLFAVWRKSVTSITFICRINS